MNIRRFTTTIPVHSQEIIYYTFNVDASSLKQAEKKIRDFHANHKLIPFLTNVDDVGKLPNGMYVKNIDHIEGGDMWIMPADLDTDLKLDDTTPIS